MSVDKLAYQQKEKKIIEGFIPAEFILPLKLKGCTDVITAGAALLPHSKKLLGSNPYLGIFCMEFTLGLHNTRKCCDRMISVNTAIISHEICDYRKEGRKQQRKERRKNDKRKGGYD